AEVSISCDDYTDGVVYASATDNCSDVTITFEDVATEGGCVLPVGQYERTYTATDACGNASTSTQLIILTDDVDPEFTSVPADYTAECDEDLVLDEATASDNCSGVTITYSEDMIEGDCPQEYTLVRTWTATDNCGNSSSVSQTITVVDTTAPQLTDTCGLMNGEEVEVCCEDISGTVTIPAACELSFTDNCDSDATSTLTETCVGDYCPTETVDSWCDITSPEALADGETCDNYATHSMRLFNFPGSEFYTTLSGTVANNSDGTQTYTMTVVSSDNPAAGWTVTANYEAGMDWATWSTQPGNHSYKSDCGLGDHTTWLYSMMIDGSASGWGDYAGSELTLSHQPSNGYFGFQIGEGANNKNGNYGFSGWIYYSGSFLEEGVMGSGDIFGDLDCCLPYDISRDYTVSDCAGNTTTFGYTVSVTGEPCEDGTGGVIGNSGGDGSNGGLVTLKDLIVIESLMPNPTSDNSTLVFETGEDISVNIDLMTMSGSLVQDLFQGNVFSNTPMTLEISTGNLDAGMYQVRLNSRDFVVTKKLLVTN
ncbi:MAG: T9SS type A sorting domain-containing protein, partial [Prochlorococcus sp.]